MSKGGSSSNTSSSNTSTITPTATTLAALQGNLSSAKSLTGDSYQPVTSAQIGSYLSPYLSSVAGTTLTDLQDQNQQQNAQNGLAAAASGAYGGTGMAVEDALTNKFYGQTAASTLANLYNTGFQSAEGTATTENTQANQFPLLLQQLLQSATQTQAQAGGSTTSGSGTSNQSTTNYNIAPTATFNPTSTFGFGL